MYPLQEHRQPDRSASEQNHPAETRRSIPGQRVEEEMCRTLGVAALLMYTAQIQRRFFQHIFKDQARGAPAQFSLRPGNQTVSQRQRGKSFYVLRDYIVASADCRKSLSGFEQRQAPARTDSQP